MSRKKYNKKASGSIGDDVDDFVETNKRSRRYCLEKASSENDDENEDPETYNTTQKVMIKSIFIYIRFDF